MKTLILTLLLQGVAAATVFGAFDVPNGIDPNMVRGDLLGVYTLQVGQTRSICIQGQDDDGVAFVDVTGIDGLQLVTQDGTAEIQFVEYSLKLDPNHIGIHYIVARFVDLHPVDPIITEATIVLDVIPPANRSGPLVMLCP